MAGRREDPNTRYRVYIHTDKKYRYAAVQIKWVDESGKSRYKVHHIGTVDEALVFTPNPVFRLKPVEEIRKYIFPAGWNLSRLSPLLGAQDQSSALQESKDNASPANESESSETAMNNVNHQDNSQNEEATAIPDTKPCNTILDQYNNKLYGSFWLLEQIARKEGVYDDLMTVFGGNVFTVNEVLSLALFPYISGKNYSRFAKWQNTHQTLLDYQLTSPGITRLTQSIHDSERMNFIRARLSRLPEGSFVDCDSTTRSAWGKCLADIRWGHNKDNPKLQNTIEVVVYALSTHQPIYYRSFPGNISDMSTIRTLIADLKALGIPDVTFIADRGYASEENIAAFIAAEIPFLICAKTCSSPVLPLLGDIAFDRNGLPSNMEYNPGRKLFSRQVSVPAYTGKLSDGTEVEIANLKANIFINPMRRSEELAELTQRILEEKSSLEEDVKSGLIPDNIRKYNALHEYFKVTAVTDSEGKVTGIAYEENTAKIARETSLCGAFSSLMSKLDISAIEALEQYKSRDEHEKNFDQMKNGMGLYCQWNSSEDGKCGRSFVSFAGLIPISQLRNVWRESMREKYQSTLDMLDEMESIRFSEYTDGSSHMTSFTTKQVEISRACGIEPPYECLPLALRQELDRKNNPKKRGRKPKAPQH